MSKLTVRERFEKYTMPEPNSGCLLWIGSVDRRGYGEFHLNGRTALAHRVAWALAGHELHDDINILHKCDNPPCVNERHLFEGTRADNLNDMALKGRGHKSLRGLPFGVWPSGRRFVAMVTIKYKRHYLGMYATADEAASVAADFKQANRQPVE